MTTTLAPFPVSIPGPESWAEAILNTTDDVHVIGAGRSALETVPQIPDAAFTIAINWHTLHWPGARPTILLANDMNVFRKVACENDPPDNTTIATAQHTYNWLKNETSHKAKVITYTVKAAGNRDPFRWALSPEEPTDQYSNSLGYALQIAYWLRPANVHLHGFDFSGPRFYDDVEHEYSLDTQFVWKLAAAQAILLKNGTEIVMHGPSNLAAWII